MRIVVSHLTRMQRGQVCVAGLDVETGQHVRPVLPMGTIQSRMTAVRGGPFDMATIVDLGLTRPVPSPPEVEDVEFTTWHARAERLVDAELFWEMLTVKSRDSLADIFGSELRAIGRGVSRRAVTDLGTGIASLGVLRPRRQPELFLSSKPDGREVVRLRLSDGALSLDLSVTDLRLHADDGARPDVQRVREVAERLGRGVPVLVGVGLTRPFAARPDETPVHWLQVNNLHLEDDPAWRLASPTPADRRIAAPVLAGVGGNPSNADDGPLF
ncbi:MAG: hypothetical protein U0893_05975 [Chloroflexota bacterium]